MHSLGASAFGPRAYGLENAKDAVLKHMQLRAPQALSLSVIHDILRTLPQSLREMTAEDIGSYLNAERPEWSFPAGYPEATFALATGVGKTRLMGALIAYLFRAGESRNFLMLAPRDAILRKLKGESLENSRKYLFAGRGLVPQPRICHKDNLLDFDPGPTAVPQGSTSLNLFIFSPQLLVAGERIDERSEFTGVSIRHYLEQCEDLVVLFDESHHLSQNETQRHHDTWSTAVASLGPKILLSMTATPRPGTNVAFEYDLRQCLREGRYTKAVRLVVDEKAQKLLETDYDLFTLKFALSRLESKERALKEHRTEHPDYPAIRPVMLVCASNVEHADEVGILLEHKLGLKSSEILVIHHEKKTETELTKLSAVESPESPIRAIVQVHVLDEGWDVSNVFVIAPLRNFGSYVNAKQVMGRGMRLPAGSRVGNFELDTLDVLSFGSESFDEVCVKANMDFAAEGGGPSGLTVVKSSIGPATGEPIPSVVDSDSPTLRNSKPYMISLSHPMTVSLPHLEMKWPEWKHDLSTEELQSKVSYAKSLLLGPQTTGNVRGSLDLSPEIVSGLVADMIVGGTEFLSAPLHGPELSMTVMKYLKAIEDTGANVTNADPLLLGSSILELVSQKYLRQSPGYSATGRVAIQAMLPIRLNVPLSHSKDLSQSSINWNKKDHFGIPIGGWKRGVHKAAAFQSKPEFQMARILDSMSDVAAWMRNSPHQIEVPTLVGHTRPDFVVWPISQAHPTTIFLEVKGSNMWKYGSQAYLNARDAKLYAKAANISTGKESLAYMLVLEESVDNISGLEDLANHDAFLQTTPN